MHMYKMYKRYTINDYYDYYDYKRRYPLKGILVELVDDFDMLYRMFARKFRKTFDKSHSSFEKYENNAKTFEEYNDITVESSFSSFIEMLKDNEIGKIRNKKLRIKRWE